MKLSIIIPVYNIESYIGQCIESVFSATISDCEIICVNDGSTDNSQQIIDGYAKRFSNLICIQQPNGGLSAARNTGLENACGDYIFFLDGDDTLANTDALPAALSICLKNKLDLFVGNAIVNDNTTYLQNYPQSNDILSGPDLMHLFFSNNRTIIEPVWCYLYNKEFLDNHNLRFKKGIYHEDILFSPQAIYLSQHCMCKDIAFVDYRTQRDGAITASLSLKHLLDKRNTARELYEFFNTHSALDSTTKRIIFDIYTSIIESATENIFSVKSIMQHTDKSIMNLCSQTKHDRNIVRLLHVSQHISSRYTTNTLPTTLRRLINGLTK